jgi:hypothetical protein
MGHPALVREREPDLLAAHPPVHECLGAACATQVSNLRGVGEQYIPWRQFQHRLLGSLGNEGCRLGQRQPPVLRVAPWITANIAVVGLCKRHTKHLPILCGPHRSVGLLGDSSKQRQTNTTVFRGPIPGSGDLAFRLCATTCVLAELSSIVCAIWPPWQEFSARAYRLRYIGRVRAAHGRYQAILAGCSSYCSNG